MLSTIVLGMSSIKLGYINNTDSKKWGTKLSIQVTKEIQKEDIEEPQEIVSQLLHTLSIGFFMQVYSQDKQEKKGFHLWGELRTSRFTYSWAHQVSHI